MRKLSAVLIISVLIAIIAFINPVIASDLPPTSVSDELLAKLEAMTLEELEAVAKPMPEEALGDLPYGGKFLDHIAKLPQDGEIYYIYDHYKGVYYQSFYRFLYVSKGGFTDHVRYHIFEWDYVDGKKDRTVIIEPQVVNPEIYRKLVGQSDNSGSKPSDIKTYTVERISGMNRIETAVAVAKKYNSGTVNNVVIATGNNFPDALAGSVLAAKLNAPILLTGSTVESSRATLDYLSGHLAKDGKVYVLGGQGAVPESILDAIRNMGFTNIKRLDGKGRYDTAKAIVDELKVNRGTPVIVATGENFPDALSISSVAAIKGYPILLVSKNALPEQTRDALWNIVPQKVYIVGGEGVISAGVQAEIQKLLSLKDEGIIRIAGNGRYETSLDIVNYFKLDSENLVLATGANFPDALTGSVLAAKINAPILLVDNKGEEQKKFIDKSNYRNLILLGGTSAISEKIEALLKQ